MNKQEYWTDTLTPQRLWAIFFIQLNEGYQLNVILPFVVFMIRDFDFSENSVGLYAGLLTATFAFCQFISSYFWGWFSDHHGRKIALLLGLSVSGIAIIIFGTSTNYIQAILARGIAGVFNGNIGVARAYAADITDGRNRSFAFSIFAVAFSGGIVLGSTAGGVLIKSYDLEENGNHIPSEGILKFWIFENDFPYLLPCIIGSIISLIAFILTVIYIQDIKKYENTNKNKEIVSYNNSYDDDAYDKDVSFSASKSMPMMSMGGIAFNNRDDSSIDNNKDDVSIIDKHRSMTLNDMNVNVELIETSIIDSNVMGTNALHDVIQSFKTPKFEKRKLLDSDTVNIESLSDLLKKTKLIHALIINSMIMMMLVGWNAMVPLLMAQKLEFDSTEIGIQMAYCGVILFIFTWWVQPPIMKKYNYKFVYITFGTLMICIIIIFPSIALIPNVINWNKLLLLAIVSFIGGFKFAFATNLVVTSFCFLNNSVPKQSIGRANGLGQALAAGLRGFGPLGGGSLWSWSMTLDNKFAIYIAYIFMAIPTAYSVIHCWIFIDKDIQKTYEERHSNNNNNKTVKQ